MAAPPPTADNQRQTLRIIWGALCCAVVLYGVVTLMVAPPAKPVASVMNMVLTILGVSMAAFAAVFYRLTIGRTAEKATATGRYQMTDEQQRTLYATVQSQAIACMSFLEAPAVFSVVLHFMGGSRAAVSALQASSLVALLVFRAVAVPRIDTLLTAPRAP